MSIQKNKPEQIVTVLRQIEVQMANGGFWCRQPGELAIMGYGASQN